MCAENSWGGSGAMLCLGCELCHIVVGVEQKKKYSLVKAQFSLFAVHIDWLRSIWIWLQSIWIWLRSIYG